MSLPDLSGEEIYGFAWTISGFGPRRPGTAPYEPARAVMTYWADFSRTGDPNGRGLTEWPVYGKGKLRMYFGGELQVGVADNREKCEFWREQNITLR